MELTEYDNLSNWMEKLYDEIKVNKITITDWKKAFKKFKLIFRDEEYKAKLNCLIYLKKLSSRINHSDFEIKNAFNSIFEDTITYLNDDNVMR
jgi:hypothetical protein